MTRTRRPADCAACGGVLNAETLQHLAEESRHAFFFKRAAEALDDVNCIRCEVSAAAGVQDVSLDLDFDPELAASYDDEVLFDEVIHGASHFVGKVLAVPRRSGLPSIVHRPAGSHL